MSYHYSHILNLLYILVVTGIVLVLYRVGVGLTKRKIALFAESEFTSLRALLVDSGLFRGNNIKQKFSSSVSGIHLLFG